VRRPIVDLYLWRCGRECRRGARSPDRIRTGGSGLRGQRARPLLYGARGGGGRCRPDVTRLGAPVCRGSPPPSVLVRVRVGSAASPPRSCALPGPMNRVQDRVEPEERTDTCGPARAAGTTAYPAATLVPTTGIEPVTFGTSLRRSSLPSSVGSGAVGDANAWTSGCSRTEPVARLARLVGCKPAGGTSAGPCPLKRGRYRCIPSVWT
jgi:hypothetical protein